MLAGNHSYMYTQDAGFNHKEFGVTSEGVVVYLDVALRKALKIDPKRDPFSIKLTGGPDGDGTLLKCSSCYRCCAVLCWLSPTKPSPC